MAFPRTPLERLWTGAVATILTVLVGGSLLFPDAVYGAFLWQYFWGPVAADAHGAAAAAWNGGTPIFFESVAEAASVDGPVAYPGYTVVSEIGYAITLLLSLSGVVFLLDRLDLEVRPGLIYPLLPFMFFGGALRVVEDAHDGLAAGTGLFAFPWSAIFISPFIYFTVFFLTLGMLLSSLWLRNRAYTDTLEWPLFGFGTGWFALTIGYLLWLVPTSPNVAFHPVFTVLTVGGATAIAAGGWWAIRRFWPAIASGTPILGGVILWAHAIDGLSNVLAIDWGAELGLPADLVPKHPVNRAVIRITGNVVPESVTAVIGVAWGFLLLKLVAATFVAWLFDERMVSESPRFSTLLLIAVIAVGLGPGVRDMLRATFGV
ncbi:MAG: DUF63 family protein [Halodesulfurarchaeum sp.]